VKHWHTWLARVNRASLRERGLLFAAGVLVLATLWQQGLMGPLDARRARLEVSLNAALKHPGDADTDGLADEYVSLRTRELALEHEIGTVDGELQDAERSMVTPKQMVAVLTDVLKAQTACSSCNSRICPCSRSQRPRRPMRARHPTAWGRTCTPSSSSCAATISTC